MPTPNLALLANQGMKSRGNNRGPIHPAPPSWLQKLGKCVVVTPAVHCYEQSAAGFYAPRLQVNPLDPDSPVPQFYAADDRLSSFLSVTAGLSVSVHATQWLAFDAGYQRYAMIGPDPVTSSSADPAANVFTMGMRLWY